MNVELLRVLLNIYILFCDSMLADSCEWYMSTVVP
jgi:hypothetical protein